tara:strand:- start:219 stop:443 length:225 start_codon:yes stop_codon:yes gene_type:complete
MKTQTYFLDSEIVCKIWIHLYESGHEELASSLSDSMIRQGCDELLGTDDGAVIFAFWKEYLLENNIIEITENLK